MAISFGQFPKEVFQVSIPSNSKAVFPSSKDRVPWLQFKERFPEVAPVAACRDVPNIIREVGIYASNLQGNSKRLQRARGWIVILRGRPRHS